MHVLFNPCNIGFDLDKGLRVLFGYGFEPRQSFVGGLCRIDDGDRHGLSFLR